MQIHKLLLREKSETGEWYGLYPMTSGDMVLGQVENARTIDGYTEKEIMKSFFDKDIMRVKKSDGTYQGIQASKIILSENEQSKHKVQAGDIWAEGTVYVNGGDEVMTKNRYQEFRTELLEMINNMSIGRASTADKLTAPVKINNVPFDGSKSITIQSFTVSTEAPSSTKTLWINPIDKSLNYYYNGRWNQVRS